MIYTFTNKIVDILYACMCVCGELDWILRVFVFGGNHKEDTPLNE